MEHVCVIEGIMGSGNYSVNDIIKATGVSKTSLYRYINEVSQNEKIL